MNLHNRLMRRMFCLLMLSAMVSATWLLPFAFAGERLEQLDSALKFVPADAAFYWSMMRNREQLEAVLGSNAWAELTKMPAVAQLRSMLESQSAAPEAEMSPLKLALQNPEVRKILDLLADMGSTEMFCYGDESISHFLELMSKVTMAVQYQPVFRQLSNLDEFEDPAQLQTAALFSVLAQNTEKIDVPNLLFGFRLKNADLAKEQLIKLEMLANMILESNDLTRGRFKKTTINDNEYLVLELDGEMIPWEELPLENLKELPIDEGDVEKVIDRLKEMKLVLALGVRGEYLLFSIGSSTTCLEKFGQKERLIDRSEFEVLEKFADRRLTAVSFISRELNRRIKDNKQSLAEMLQMIEQWVAESELSDDVKLRIVADAKALAGDLKALFPEPAPVLTFNFLTSEGIESYQYEWGKARGSDEPKPLGLLEHVGGRPLLALFCREQIRPADYEVLTKWLKILYGYFRDFALPTMDDEERVKVELFLDRALPLFEKMDQVTREKFIPAVADGQWALVIDGKFYSRRFHQDLPEMEKEMPMVEPALLIGLSDAELFKQALSDYRLLINELIDAVRGIDSGEMPDFRLPEPKRMESSVGEIFCLPLPEDNGLDERIVPSLGIAKSVAAFSLTREHTERLLQATPLRIGGLLKESNRPLVGAGWLDWPALLEAADPWIDYTLPRLLPQDSDTAKNEEILSQIRTARKLLGVLRAVTSETYPEGNTLVTHTLVELRDLEK